MSDRTACFKAYDIRGRVPAELDAGLAYQLGLAYARELRPPGEVAVGYDIRPSSLALARALSAGLRDGGSDVALLGLCGTEVVYHAAACPGRGGGIMITASHNPAEYNGLKLVIVDAARGVVRPVTRNNGLERLEACVEAILEPAGEPGAATAVDETERYAERVLRFIDGAELAPLKVVVNAGNGCAGPFVDALAPRLPFELVRVHHEPDGTFPHGVPNPLLPENRTATAEAVRRHGADLGVAWDGDFDRCFLFDEQAEFVEGYYIVGLLAEELLRRHGGGRVVHDPRLYWNTVDQVTAAGGRPVRSKTGHARIKEVMVEQDCLYGGEMSAHHYFRDFAYCDTGMVPWLLVAAAISRTGRPLGELVGERQTAFPCSGEINREVADPGRLFDAVEAAYAPRAAAANRFDGLSMECGEWRFNLRQSDTQPELVRLNVESRGDAELMRAKTDELLALLGRL